MPGQEERPFQVVPPELAIAPDVAGRDEDSRRDFESLQDGLRRMEVIRIAVIEGDDDRPAVDTSPAEGPSQVSQRRRPGHRPDDLKVLGEEAGRDAEPEGV